MKYFITFLLLTAYLFGTSQVSWKEVPIGTTEDLNAIDFPSPAIGYIVGNDSTFLKTTDGGATWTQLNPAGISFGLGSYNIVDLDFVAEDTGFIALGPNSRLFKTVDGGQNWTELQSGFNQCFTSVIHFFNGSEGFMGGMGCFHGEDIIQYANDTFVKSKVLGMDFVFTPNGVRGLDFSDDRSVGLGASTGGYILRSTDGGANWDTVTTGLTPNQPLTSVTMVNDTLAYAGYDNLGVTFGSGLLKSTDGGLSWAMDINSATFYYPAFHEVHTTPLRSVFSGAEPSSIGGGLIFESSPTGIWSFQQVDQPIHSISSQNDTVVWAVGDSGYVLKSDSVIGLGISKERIQQNVTFYPNPAANTLFLEWENRDAYKVQRIEVFNLSGQTVKVIDQPSDTIPIDELNSGLYFLHILTDKGSSIKKFMKQ